MGLRSFYKPIPSQTPEGKERLRAYYEALGRFVDAFSRTEHAAHSVLRFYAKMSIKGAQVLLSGVRVDETKNRLSRLHDAGMIEDADWKDIEPILQQLNTINGRRNDILHHGAEGIAEGHGVVTTARMAITEDRITDFHISPEILADMTEDLRKIRLHFHTRHMGRPPLLGIHPELSRTLHAPWRYTQQPKPRGATRPSKQARKSRPPTSPK